MKNATQCAKGFAALLKKMPGAEPAEVPEAGEPIAALVLSFLIEDATTERAITAYTRLREHMVDFNDLLALLSGWGPCP